MTDLDQKTSHLLHLLDKEEVRSRKLRAALDSICAQAMEDPTPSGWMRKISWLVLRTIEKDDEHKQKPPEVHGGPA